MDFKNKYRTISFYDLLKSLGMPEKDIRDWEASFDKKDMLKYCSHLECPGCFMDQHRKIVESRENEKREDLWMNHTECCCKK